MRTLISAFTFGAVLLSVSSTPSLAGDVTLKQFKIKDISEIVILPSEAATGVEAVYQPGDNIVTAPIGIESAAMLEASSSFEIFGYPAKIGKGEILSEATMKGGDLESFGKNAVTYCHSVLDIPEQYRPKAKMKDGSDGAQRLDRDSRICLIDTDNNSSFDRALLIGTNWKEDRGSMAIDAVPYTKLVNEPIPMSFVSLQFQKGAILQGPIITPVATLVGRPVNIVGIRINQPGQNKIKSYGARGVKKSDYPYEIEFGDAKVTLTGYDDSEGRNLKVRVDKNFTTSPLAFEYPTQYIYVTY